TPSPCGMFASPTTPGPLALFTPVTAAKVPAALDPRSPRTPSPFELTPMTPAPFELDPKTPALSVLLPATPTPEAWFVPYTAAKDPVASVGRSPTTPSRFLPTPWIPGPSARLNASIAPANPVAV